ncbi:MAG: 30S ribosomal protein S8 [Bacilli bacterium]|nr:30S ribosomal protein S8 [Bacilli bacterium]
MVEDRIADMLTRIRNANQMKYDTVEVLGSKMTVEIARILKEEGYISDYVLEEAKNGNKITINLKYTEGKKTRVITGLKRISKSGLRVYAKHDELPRVLNGLGIAIISTSEGIMTDRDARNKKLGGEVLAYIW